MLNRNNAPTIQALSVPNILPYTRRTLSNGSELFILNNPSQEVFKLDVIFEAGTFYQPHPLIATTALNLLNEGTRRHKSAEIAEIFDFYGAGVDFNCGSQSAEASIFSLVKYAHETIPLLSEMVYESIFPKHEIEIYLRNKKQSYLTDQEKTSWLARKELNRLLFGESHPYSNTLSEKDFDTASEAEIKNFYKAHIKTGKCKLFLSGNITDTVLQEVEKAFGGPDRQGCIPPVPEYVFSPSAPGHYHVEKADSVQTSIRIGKKGLQLSDPDYAGFMLLNTILGGYFGSRLMSNIREEKGYTYGIQSFNVSLPITGYWSVTTDVDNRYTNDTITEIQKEIKILQHELVTEGELSLVKNYLHGDLLREIDGVFAQAESLKLKTIYNTDNRIYIDMIKQMNSCTSQQIRDLANRYLNQAEFYIVTAGSSKI